MNKRLRALALFLVVLSFLFSLSSCFTNNAPPIDLDNIPAFSGEPYVIINNNVPFFESEELVTTSYESYGKLDNLNRCTAAFACIGKDLMPTEDRGDISDIKPTGWQSVKYNGQYLYNRCHLIGFQLTGENANKENLITGTRYMNVDGMLPFENMVADYIKETENHVMYRVTPIFDGNNLVANGVLMEAYSVEDEGELCFNVYVYNNQPGVSIDYATGASSAQEQSSSSEKKDYAVNTSTKKYHKTDCTYASSNNVEIRNTTEVALENEGYSPCGKCNP